MLHVHVQQAIIYPVDYYYAALIVYVFNIIVIFYWIIL